jgi:ABC-type multidrug transport system fused ATPase/permease subunit
MHVARRRYASRMQWIEHERAKRLVNTLITARESATEIRVHQVGPFLLDHFHEMGQTAEAEQLPDQVSFENVSFTYPDRDTPALQEVTLTFPRGAVIALVGATAAASPPR